MIDIRQIYETEIVHFSGISFRAITIPQRSISNPREMLRPESIADQLNIDLMASVEPDLMHEALAAVLATDSPERLAEWREYGLYGREISEVAAYYEFSKYLINEAPIPFENSPLGAESLANLGSKLGGPGIGAFVGFLIAGSTPVLLITVPAGMIICGAAFGIAQGLEQGMRERIRRYIDPSGKPDDSDDDDQSPDDSDDDDQGPYTTNA